MGENCPGLQRRDRLDRTTRCRAAQILEGEMLAQMKRQARFYAELERDDLFSQQTTAGEDRVERTSRVPARCGRSRRQRNVPVLRQGDRAPDRYGGNADERHGSRWRWRSPSVTTRSSAECWSPRRPPLNIVSMAMEITTTVESVTLRRRRPERLRALGRDQGTAAGVEGATNPHTQGTRETAHVLQGHQRRRFSCSRLLRQVSRHLCRLRRKCSAHRPIVHSPVT